MEVNFDEALLTTKRVDPNFDEPILNQTLRIAAYYEYHSYEVCKKVIEKFGALNPFANIIVAEENHINAILVFLQKYNIEAPINNWAEKIAIPDSFIECCELGVASEINNIRMYDNLLLNTQEEEIKDLFFRLQAASYNNHLPAFRANVLSHYNSKSNNIDLKSIQNPDDMMKKMDEFKTIATKIASGEVGPEEITKLLSNTNISFIGGMILGGIGTSLVTNKFDKDKGEE